MGNAAKKQERAYRVICDAADRSPEWLAARDKMITASDVATVMGLNPYKSPYALWSEKMGYKSADEAGEAAAWGLRMEPVILDAYREETSRWCKPVQHLCASVRYPFIGATCDAQVGINGETCPLELKTASEYLLDRWAEGCADYYVPQVQTQMLVMGSSRASVAVLIGGNKLRWCDVDADPDMQARIIEACADFMRRIEEDDPPPIDGHESTTAALRLVHPAEEPGEVVSLDAELLEATKEIERLQVKMKELGAEVDTYKNRIIAALGDAERGVLPDGSAWTLKSQTRKSYERGPLKSETVTRVLRRSKK